eukprot:scaffold18886_cov108-Cylindrotheca_fusiformis.AAC.4
MGHADASSPKSPKKGSILDTSERKRIVGKKIESSKTTTHSTTKMSKSKPEAQRSSGKLQRQMMEIRTTLENVDIGHLEAAEMMFYEDCFKQAAEMTQDQAGAETQVSIRSVMVENDHEEKNQRGLRRKNDRSGSRYLWQWNPWYDIWAVMEVFSCRFCGFDDDDDFLDTVADYPRYSLFDDDDDYAGLTPMRDIDHGWHRALGVSDSFESVLCELLRQGPHERFHYVKKCSLEFSKW